MKSISILLVSLLVSFHSTPVVQPDIRVSEDTPQTDNRIEELDRYWAALAKSAKEGDFNGMKSLYHEDAVMVKMDTTISISEAFKYRWKKEIMEVKDGKRANTLEFRFSKRLGNHITAFEQGIYHYTSIETSTGNTLGDSYIHFETLLVKVKGQWVGYHGISKDRSHRGRMEGLGVRTEPLSNTMKKKAGSKIRNLNPLLAIIMLST